MKPKATFKFNNSQATLLCSNCQAIIKTLTTMTPKERKAMIGKVHLPPQYCDKCKPYYKHTILVKLFGRFLGWITKGIITLRK